MGFWGDVWGGIKKVGSAIGKGFRKVGEVVTSPETWKKIGSIGGKVVDIAKKISPFVRNIPILGSVVGAVSKAGNLVDLAKKAGEGDIKGALFDLGRVASGVVPGAAGQALGKGLDIAERFSG